MPTPEEVTARAHALATARFRRALFQTSDLTRSARTLFQLLDNAKVQHDRVFEMHLQALYPTAFPKE